ncbi:MAG: helix-turn-helix transcriptional regulator [Bacteroidales bacterium]|nr:helix-turn-helix transcriptional regulator [Bacteroidales bacterium]
MKTETLDIKTIHECNRCLGCKTLHPQASIINLENPSLEPDVVKFEFYAILLIEEAPDGCCCCGRKYYDYSTATMVFLKPGEIFRMSEAGALPRKGWLLAFHPDLLHHTSLRSHIRAYTFFSYRREEALHLSQRETATVTCLLQHIEAELHHAIDTHTATILSRHIELVLDYCTRFYERQFITRENKNKAMLDALERILSRHILSGRLSHADLPTAQQCADALGLSLAYFTDLLKFELGTTFENHFQLKRIDAAKTMLTRQGQTPAVVARQLGYPSVQHFSLLFKKLTGVAPSEYRLSLN